MTAEPLERVRAAVRPLSSPPAEPGWNRAQIQEWLGDAPRVPAAVLLLLRDNADCNVVLTRRTEQLRRHAGQVSFPGGSMEPDDVDAVDTALREAEEEIGVSRDAVTPIGFLDCFETISGFCVTPVVARLAADSPPLVIDSDEVAEIFEVPLAFFLDPVNLRRYCMEYRGQRRPMVEFRYGDHRIWGATAAMLLNLLRRMRRA